MQEKSDTPSVKGKNYADFSRDELIAEINRLKKTKKYGLVWEHKKEEVIENFKAGQQPYLKEVEDKRIENAPGEPTNLIIEGDNFDALSVLNYTHAGKIDVVYIDPPYNTGNKDFIYNDNYVDSEDAFRHSKWLSFMEPRLKLAKNLLAEDGVIFISIGDFEQSDLKLLCDGEFGFENFLGCLVRKTQNGVNNKAVYFSPSKDYILVYGNNESTGSFYLDEKIDRKKYKYIEDKDEEHRGVAYAIGESIYKTGLIGERPNSVFEIECPDGEVVVPPSGKHFKWSEKRFYKEYDPVNGICRVVFKKTARSPLVKKDGSPATWNIYEKNYLLDGNDLKRKVQSDLVIDSLYTNTQGTKEIGDIGLDFDYPKPASVIKYLLKITQLRNATVLDFFAGSGTTGQAVLELNKEDGGHRQFILCTNNGDKGPDSTKIAEEITYPRIKTVITGKRQDGSKYSDGIPANLRYYKIKHEQKLGSNDANRLEMSKHMEDILQIKENAFEEVKTGRTYKLYKNSEKYLCLALDAFEMEKIIEKITEEDKEKLDTVIYSFSYSRDAFEDDYGADFNIEFKAMPEGLLKTYLNITESLRSED